MRSGLRPDIVQCLDEAFADTLNLGLIDDERRGKRDAVTHAAVYQAVALGCGNDACTDADLGSE